MDIEIKTFINSIDAIELSIEEKEIFNRSNYFKFRDTKTLIAIKISRSAKPFFGIGKKFIDFANHEGKFYLILLISDKSGWCYSKNEVNSNIKNGFWKYREEDDNYKINHGDLSDMNYFTSNNIFLSKINQRGGKGDIITQ